MLGQARKRDLPVRGLRWSGLGLPDFKRIDVVVWDSLFFDRLACMELSHSPYHLLLCHFLPSLNPTLCLERRQALRAMEEAVLTRMAGVIATGPKLAEELRLRYPWIRVELCEPGVEECFLSPRLKVSPSSPSLEWITVANLLPAKGYLEMLDILARLHRYSWRWHWVGARPDPLYALHLQMKIRRHGLGGRIVDHGEVSPVHLPRLLDAADWFLFPSWFESFGMALQEAVARRLPIISSRVGAAERWVVPGRTGFLLEPGAWTDFAKVIRRCLVDPRPKRIWQLGYRYLPSPPTWGEVFERWWKAVEALV